MSPVALVSGEVIYAAPYSPADTDSLYYIAAIKSDDVVIAYCLADNYLKVGDTVEQNRIIGEWRSDFRPYVCFVPQD